MQELIEQGIKQGTLLHFANNLNDKDVIVGEIKNGRFGTTNNDGVGPTGLLLVLTQECGIAARNSIEVVQGKKAKKFNEVKNQHLVDAQDYGKLVVKVGDDFYEFKEKNLAKLNQEILLQAIHDKRVEVGEEIAPWQKRRLLDWRILEYFREAFPDKFNRSFNRGYRQGTGQWFTEFLHANQDNIDSVRIYISPDDEEHADQYHVAFCALLTPKCSFEQETDIAQAFETMIEELTTEAPFIISLQSSGYEGELELPEGVTLALTARYDEFTFANAYEMKEYNFEFLCY